MKKNKLITALLSVSMLTASIGALPTMAEDDPVVYTYIGENSETVNITQSELEAGHWDANALGNRAPFLYESFPMDITGFVNDFAEISFDIAYMKKLDEMDSVTLKIQNVFDSSIIYDDELDSQSFYSPILTVGELYDVVITETLNGTETEYEKVFEVNEIDSALPDYVYGTSIPDNDPAILIKDIDTLRSGYSTNENGGIEIDSSIARYDRVQASEFGLYCNSLDNSKIYRIYTNTDGERYSGFLKFNNGVAAFYDLEIEEYHPQQMTQLGGNSLMSVPSNITISTVKSYAQDMRLSDASFHLRETSNNTKWASFEMDIPDDYADETRTGTFYISISADTQVTAKIWCETASGNATLIRTVTSSNNTNSIQHTITTTNYSPCTYIRFFVMVYFPATTEGYGMVNFSSGTGYSDDVTGSISGAYNGDNSYYSLSNSEYTMTDSWDLDAFAFDYWGTNSLIYKVEIKNRSLAQQALLENGVSVTGSAEKQLILWYIDSSATSLEWFEDIIYAVPKNADLTVYVDPVSSGDYVISINNKATGLLTSNKYQLAFAPII